MAEFKYVIVDSDGKFSVRDTVHSEDFHDDLYYKKEEIFWMPPVDELTDLPESGNKHGDTRIVTELKNVFVWIEEESSDINGNTVFIGEWLPIFGKYWGMPVAIISDLPATNNADGEIRLVIDSGFMYRWDDNSSAWVLITQPGDLAFWMEPVASFASLPMTGNADGDIRMALDSNHIYTWEGSTSEWVDVDIGVDQYWLSPVATEGDLPLTGSRDGEMILTREQNEIWRWDEGASEWVEIHQRIIDMLTPPGYGELSGNIPISPAYSGYLSDGNTFVDYSAGDAHTKLINSLPITGGDMTFGPSDKGTLTLYKNGVLKDTLDMAGNFDEDYRAGNQPTVPWTSPNGYIVMTFCGMYDNVPINQYATFHLVFNSGWVTTGDNSDITVKHEI